MKTRHTETNFPADLAMGFWPMLAAMLSWLVAMVMVDRGWLWLTAYGIGLTLVVIGAIQMWRAKRPLYRDGQFYTWGPATMAPPSKRLYFNALKWIAAGVLIVVILLVSRFCL